MTDRRDMEAVAEAILFVANEPVTRTKLLEVFPETQREKAAEALEAVIERYRQDPVRGVVIDEAAGGLRLVSRPDLHGYLRRFFEVTGTNKLTMAGLETLAIIAYRQPITSPEIQELRSVNSSGVLKTLLERRLIRIAGRKEVVGKPFLYATTREFLMRFGLRSLKELPPLEQFDELFGGEDEPVPEGTESPDTEEEILREVAELEEAEAEEEADEAEEAEEPETPEEPETVEDARTDAEGPPPEPDSVEPDSAEPEPTDPEPADPDSAEPEPTDPEPAEPQPDEPEPTEPASDEPAPDEPPLEPAP